MLFVVSGSTYYCSRVDCLGPKRVGICANFCRNPTRRPYVRLTKPPGWVGIDCKYCFSWQSSKNEFIRSNCKHGCLPGGLNPFSTTPSQHKTRKQQSTLTTTISTTIKTNTPYFTKPKTTIKWWFCNSNIGLLTQETTPANQDGVNNPKAYIWLLVGILGGFVVLVGLFVASSTLLGKLSKKIKTNKIGPTDVIIHHPENYNMIDVYVISSWINS